MLNGKFYTGLTANQMNRTRGPDRQKSSFFWPDETDTVPSPNNRNGRIRPGKPTMTRSATQSSRMSEESNNAKPKDLFHKQLTSRIEFYDEPIAVKQSKRNEGFRSERPTKSSIEDMSTLRRDISDIAEQIEKPRREAKLEYNDYAEDATVRESMQKPKPSASPNEQQRKKITFTEPKLKKGILKNNEVSRGQRNDEFLVEQIPSFKKNITPNRRLQLSKSMDNMARLASSETQSSSKRNNVEHEKTVVRQKKELGRKYVGEHSEQNAFEEYEDEYVNRKPTVREVREDNDKEKDDYGGKLQYFKHEESNDDWSDRNGNHLHRNRRSEHHNQPQTSVINNTGRYHREEYTTKSQNVEMQRYENHRSTPSPPPSVTKHPINPRSNDDVGYAKHYHHVTEAPGRRSIERSAPQSAPIQHQASTHQYNNKHYPNEAAVRAQSHLRSSIFFNDNAATSRMDSERPRSVRESAVSRVGVGLPNI